ncbi:MAG TPA: DNA replication and repair protein RecF [Gemmatimonadaceae bacterium]|nr:DNA replication and repair protein RecF [Gemmatimonadaceae bacterium]
MSVGWIGRLSIRDFRNLSRVEIEPPVEGFVLVGDNGEGKTNFLEAIQYLQILRSFRGALDRELVSFGKPGFHLAADLIDAPVHRVGVGFVRAGRRKKATLDGVEPARLSQSLGTFPAVVFSPQDVALVSGAPSVRRHFLDVVLALTSPVYLAALQRYRASLARRNAALRDGFAPDGGARARRAAVDDAADGSRGGRQGGSVEERVAVWEPALAEYGAVLWRERRRWVESNAEEFRELCVAIGERGTPAMRYVGGGEGADDLEATLRAALERKRALDLKRGLTHVGPHRDDLALLLDDHELRTFGSAGQQRTAAMALRLLEAATLRAHAGREPVVLLDDPFAELDVRRSTRILELLDAGRRGQTILAVPRESDIPQGLTRLARWRISAGVIAPSASASAVAAGSGAVE